MKGHLQKKMLSVALVVCLIVPIMLILVACGGNKISEFTVQLVDANSFMEKVDFTITSDNVSKIKDEAQGIHEYQEKKEVFLHLKIKDDYVFNHRFDVEKLETGIYAYSKAWVDADAGAKIEINNLISQKYNQLISEGFTSEEIDEKMLQDSTYLKYSPLQIEWVKVGKNQYNGKIVLTKNIVFMIEKNFIAKDSFQILAFSNSFNYRYQFQDENKVTDLHDLKLSPEKINFPIDNQYFTVLLEEKPNQTNPLILKKLYFIYLSTEPTSVTKEDIKNSEYVFECNLTYMYDNVNEKYYYESDFILHPESLNDQLYTSEYRYIAMYFEAE